MSLSIRICIFALASLALFGATPSPNILKRSEVKTLLAETNSPSSHERLALHYTALAERQELDAAAHEALANEFAAHPQIGAKTPMSPRSVEHCKYYAEHCRKAADSFRALASLHASLAAE